MGRVEKLIEIKAPPEKVWEMLPLDRLTEWSAGYKGAVKSVEYTSKIRTPEDKLRVGATAQGLPKKQGNQSNLKWRLRRVSKMRRLRIVCMVRIKRL